MSIKSSQILAIIPARANSKRLKLKNIKPFFGKPIIEYSIDAALKSLLFEEVMVSTDSEVIKNYAENQGAKVPFFRSTKNSDDFATLSDVVIEVIQNYEKLEKYFSDICCILATAPFLTAKTLTASYEKFIKSGATSLYPVVEYNQPVQRAYKINNGRVSMFWPEFYNTRSQDLEKSYYDAGLFYWIKAKDIIKSSSLTKYTVPYVLSEDEVQDIDTEQDWKIAEEKFKNLHQIRSML